MKACIYILILHVLSLNISASPMYTWVQESLSTLNPTPTKMYELDIDQNSAIDLIFYSDWTSCSIVPQNGNKLVLRNGNVAALDESVTIGETEPQDCDWLSSASILNQSDAATPSAAGNISGEYFATNAFLGLQFSSGENIHYAWVRIYNPDAGWPGGWLMDYAYESTPGTSISTSQIPEPTTIGLITLGLLTFTIIRKRK